MQKRQQTGLGRKGNNRNSCRHTFNHIRTFRLSYVCFGFTAWIYVIGGVLTLSIMVLPTIMSTTEEALKAVPDSYREGSFGLGAGKLRTVFKIVLPSAIPGIFSGVVLSTGRIVGETAALIFTAGTAPSVPKSIFSSTRTLAVHMYSLLSRDFIQSGICNGCSYTCDGYRT